MKFDETYRLILFAVCTVLSATAFADDSDDVFNGVLKKYQQASSYQESLVGTWKISCQSRNKETKIPDTMSSFAAHLLWSTPKSFRVEIMNNTETNKNWEITISDGAKIAKCLRRENDTALQDCDSKKFVEDINTPGTLWGLSRRLGFLMYGRSYTTVTEETNPFGSWWPDSVTKTRYERVSAYVIEGSEKYNERSAKAKLWIEESTLRPMALEIKSGFEEADRVCKTESKVEFRRVIFNGPFPAAEFSEFRK